MLTSEEEMHNQEVLLNQTYDLLYNKPFELVGLVLIAHLQRIISDKTQFNSEEAKIIVKEIAAELQYKVSRIEEMSISRRDGTKMKPPKEPPYAI